MDYRDVVDWFYDHVLDSIFRKSKLWGKGGNTKKVENDFPPPFFIVFYVQRFFFCLSSSLTSPVKKMALWRGNGYHYRVFIVGPKKTREYVCVLFFSFPLSSVLFKLQDTLHVLVAGTVRLGEWNDRPSRRCVGGGIRKMGGSWVPTASGCCCFSSPVSQNIVHARLKREGERDEASSWIEYQRGYLNLGRQITHPQNHHHHLRDQTFKSVCPFFCFLFVFLVWIWFRSPHSLKWCVFLHRKKFDNLQLIDIRNLSEEWISRSFVKKIKWLEKLLGFSYSSLAVGKEKTS